MKRIKLVLEYDGTDFSGWQVQPDERTVQGVLQECLTDMMGAETKVTGSGRTDAGVHAIGQVIAFNIVWKHTLAELQRALNANLPRDIIVNDLKITDDDFRRERILKNGWKINSKEELLYYRFFKEQFNGLEELSWMGRTKGISALE